MVLWDLFCLFYFHISEVLNNKTVFTDDITPKLFSYTCNSSHFLKMTVPVPHVEVLKAPGVRNKSFAAPRLSPSLETNTPHRLEIQLSGPGKKSPTPPEKHRGHRPKTASWVLNVSAASTHDIPGYL